VLVALGGLGAFAALAASVVIAHRATPFGLDAAVNTWVAGNRWQSLIDVALFLAAIGAGTTTGLVVPGVIVLALVISRRWREAIVLVVALLFSAAAVQILKTLIHRARPPHAVVYEPSWSFPSGHTAQAATIVVALMMLLRRQWIIVAGTLYAVSMAISRIYLGVHWVTDVIGGLVFGGSVAVLIVALGWCCFRSRAVRGTDVLNLGDSTE
jgi:membrane-associated phospholipid phosphatase